MRIKIKFNLSLFICLNTYRQTPCNRWHWSKRTKYFYTICQLVLLIFYYNVYTGYIEKSIFIYFISFCGLTLFILNGYIVSA